MYVSFCFLVQPCFGWQLKLPVAVSGVIFFESMKIERLFQFTLMTCYLPYIYQNHSQNERHARSTKTKRKRMLSAKDFYHPFCAFSRCNAVVSLLKNSNIILLIRLFSLLISQFAVVRYGLICLANLVERCCGDGQETLYS